MAERICPTCGKVFKHKSDFDKHMNRKNPCKPPIEDKFDLLIKKMEELERTNKELQIKNKEFEKEIKQLKKQQVKTISNSNNTNSGNTNTMNIIVMPKAHGKENLDFLELNDILSKKILTKGFQSIPEYIKVLYFDENKPENHNIYMPNWRDKTRILVYDGKTWNLQNATSTIDDLKNKGIEFIQRKYDELDKNNPADAKIITKLSRFLDSYNSEEKDKIDILNEDICLVLYNNREITKKTRKSMEKDNEGPDILEQSLVKPTKVKKSK